MPDPIKAYLKQIEAALAAGNATEHTHRPALKALIEALAPGVTAINEPQRIACGAPDFVVQRTDLTGFRNLSGLFNLGYIEAKDVGKSLDEAERTEQLARYRRALPNLILTDYLEFRWYAEGELRSAARLARTGAGGKLTAEKGGVEAVAKLLGDFLAHQPAPITSPQLLAVRMARLAHLIRDMIAAAFDAGQASALLSGWREAFARTLIADLDQPEKTGEFADMLAQTLAYGLFAARVMDISPGFTRQEAQHLIPKTNPFLRDFFYQVTGPQMDDEPFAGFVDDLAALLAAADMNAILADFGARTGQADPVMHFYETFLAAYDPKLRETRGVYFTPSPVAAYIVRAVDALLRTGFQCPQGLADSTQVEIDNPAPAPPGKGGARPAKKLKIHKVLLLDPATGTATFPYAAIDHIRASFIQSGNAGLWSSYVREHLLPRLFGFELLMAPYAVAHFKLGLQLAALDLPEAQRKAWAYDFQGDERVGVYLTNTLEGPHEHTGLPLFTQFLARETDAADRIKQDLPVLVIFGNPPYSGHSANKGKWIEGLLKGQLPDGTTVSSYYELDGQPLGERNPKWLQDDYVKFIRWAQWRIAKTGSGILAFITSHSYLDNPTFRGMRRALMQTFTDIYVLDLHGNAKKREVAPGGGKDENVFDIQQGVAIGIFVKEPGKTAPAQVHHAELWGKRQDKYDWLLENGLETTPWQVLNPQAPFYLFVPQNVDSLAEYQQGWKVTDILPVNSVGIVTARDGLTIHWSAEDVMQTVRDFVSLPVEAARAKYRLGTDVRDWKVHLAQQDVQTSGPYDDKVIPILYRPFDTRFTYYTGQTRGFICMPRAGVMGHMLRAQNLGLVLPRRVEVSGPWTHTLATNQAIEHVVVSLKTIDSLLPLYLSIAPNAETTEQTTFFNTAPWPPDARGRVPNLAPAFVAAVEARLELKFAPSQTCEVSQTSQVLPAVFTPEDIFGYIYAIFHAPAYRSRYAEFLKLDFPRVPLTADPALFRQLAALGRELVARHLLDADAAPALRQPITRYPVGGDNTVEKGHPRYDDAQRRVYISADNVKTGQQGQYFDGVPPAVWDFQVGGYQPCRKWLKDRVGRRLTYDDLTHYQRIVVALSETIRLMDEIEATVGEWSRVCSP